MKSLFLLLAASISYLSYSQKLDLTSDMSIREFLNDKEIKVGDYGSIIFYYDKFNREFGSIDFKVSYRLPERTIPLKATIILSMDAFSFPNYVRSISLSDPNSYKMLSINAPTIFQLFENGEIYYQDRSSMTMVDYINSITSGKSYVNSPIYKRCD